MSSLLSCVRCVAVLGPRCTQVRGVKRWLRPYLMMLERKKQLEEPPKPVPRYQQPHFDYHAEIVAFSKRLNESFSTDLLKTAFVNHSYVIKEEKERSELGLDNETASLNLQDNRELAQHGLDFTVSYLTSTIQQAFPNLPTVGVKALVDYLTCQQVLCHIAKHLGVEDLTLSSECPVSPETLQNTFYGVIGALLQSSGAHAAGRFIQDFLISELIGKDLFDIWSVMDPMSLLVEQLSKRNVPPPEPRLTKQSGASTVLPVYFVGLYCPLPSHPSRSCTSGNIPGPQNLQELGACLNGHDQHAEGASNKQLISEGPGETIFAAEEEAARVALRKMFGFAENRRPWDRSTSRQGTEDGAKLDSVC